MIYYPDKEVFAYLTPAELVSFAIPPNEVSLELANKPVTELELSERAQHVLNLYGITYVGELNQDILKLPGIGTRFLSEISSEIKKHIGKNILVFA